MFKKGYIQIYTGNGKGKTTASLGLALRVLGAGGKVFFAQFIKGKPLSSEFKALDKFKNFFTYESFGKGRFIKGKPAHDDIELAKRGLSACTEAMASGNYDLVVMDELNGAIKCSLISIADVLSAIENKNDKTELIITGRNAPEELVKTADLVTDMQAVKHYFENGVAARTGIER